MSTKLLAGKGLVWKDLDQVLSRESRADIAVAYLGQGGAARLKGLPRGSWLVVNASLAAVKAGATSPRELLKLHNRGVKVFSAPQLHAKIYAFRRRVYIGSANVSANAADKLDEAALRVTDVALVRKARQFVRGLATDRLGPNELADLAKAYKPPRSVGGGGRVKGSKRGPKVWFDEFEGDELPKGSENAVATQVKAAKAQLQDARHFHTQEIWHVGNQIYREGDTVVMVETEPDNRKMVWPPGRVISAFRWSNQYTSRWFAILEVPKAKRTDLGRLAGRSGAVWKRAPAFGALPKDLALPLMSWWNERLT
jgi:hypothetical protein